MGGSVARVTLRDGAQVFLRPLTPDDRDGLREGIERLSPESRYRRFLTAMPELPERQLRHLVEIDHHDHEALGAFDCSTGGGAGVARYVRLTEDPESAEIAVAVADDWQGRGVGTALLDRLSQRAREEGIVRMRATLLADNDAVLGLLGHLGPVRLGRPSDGVVDAEVDLGPTGAASNLAPLLKSAARGDIEMAPERSPLRAR